MDLYSKTGSDGITRIFCRDLNNAQVAVIDSAGRLRRYNWRRQQGYLWERGDDGEHPYSLEAIRAAIAPKRPAPAPVTSNIRPIEEESDIAPVVVAVIAFVAIIAMVVVGAAV